MTPFSPGPFCTLLPERILLSNTAGWVIRNGFPVSPVHTLVIAKQHVGSFFDLTNEERNGLMARQRGKPCRTCTSTSFPATQATDPTHAWACGGSFQTKPVTDHR